MIEFRANPVMYADSLAERDPFLVDRDNIAGGLLTSTSQALLSHATQFAPAAFAEVF